MKVFGWHGSRQGIWTREIVAANSRQKAALAAGFLTRSGNPAPGRMIDLCETMDRDEVAQANTKPGAVFFRRYGDWMWLESKRVK